VDAWWEIDATPAERDGASVAARHGLGYREREIRRSEVSSFELERDGRPCFSFQIAPKSRELAPPLRTRSPWAPIGIEPVAENLAAKMSALVARGAPRDFVDVRTAVLRGLLTVADAWSLWGEKNPGADPLTARALARKHLASIALRRPLADVPEAMRAEVEEARRWVTEVLLA